MVLAALLGLSACGENSWNDQLDGFEVPPVAAGTETVVYTLTSADYSTIASLSANKSLAEEKGLTDALAAIDKNGCFANEEDARLFIPAFISQQSFPYFSLNNGSSLKITYKLAENVPAEITALNAGIQQLRLSETDYQKVWESDDDFINAFAPVRPASEYLPGILSATYPDATDGQYAYVQYNESAINPVFGNVGGGSDKPVWEPTSVIATLTKDDTAEIRGVVTGIGTSGFVVTDASNASILCYQKSGFDPNTVAIGAKVNVTGAVSNYNDGLQVGITPDDYAVVEEGTFSYPSPNVLDGAKADALAARDANNYYCCEYVQYEATVKVTESNGKTYTNLIIEGASVQGSAYSAPSYFADKLADGTKHTFTGYVICVSGKGKYLNTLFTAIDGVSKSPRMKVCKAPAAEVVPVAKTAVYQFSKGKWAQPSKTIVLQPADYAAMGQKYGNLSGTLDDTLLPAYLKNALPYASEGDVENVVYLYYANNVTSVKARQYVLTAGEWVSNVYMADATDQFTRKDNTWSYNPSVVLTLPYERNTDPSYTYYMACVNWVYENICVPMGDTSLTSGKYFIDYRGNAEFYSGASAYYGNVDVRASTAKNNAPSGYTGYDGLSDEQIVLLIKKRFCTETMKGALEALHPDMAPVEGMEVTFTINFTAYDGTAKEETVVYNIVDKGKFEYVSSTWVTEEESADWK